MKINLKLFYHYFCAIKKAHKIPFNITYFFKIFCVKKNIYILNYGNAVMRTDPIFLSFGLFLPSSLNRYDDADGITLPQRW